MCIPEDTLLALSQRSLSGVHKLYGKILLITLLGLFCDENTVKIGGF